MVLLAVARILPRRTLRRWARGRAQRGLLNRLTGRLFRVLWGRSQCGSDLLRLLRFERERGTVVPVDLVSPLQSYYGSATGDDLWSSALFLLEKDVTEGLNDRRDALLGIPRPSPPIAAFLRDSGAQLKQPHERLAELHVRQERWREEFRRTLVDESRSLCVVGNSAHLRGSGCGSLVDTHDIVVRFNRFGSGPEAEVDLGKRFDVWVCAYDYLEQLEHLGRKPPTWLVLSGPDVRYRWQTWRVVDAALQQGAKVLTVPYASWIPLVERLQAPASAGVLMLQWLIDLVGDPATINVAGFQSLWSQSQLGYLYRASRRQYHYRTPKHRAGRRHNWVGEREILLDWFQRGLRFIDHNLRSATGR